MKMLFAFSCLLITMSFADDEPCACIGKAPNQDGIYGLGYNANGLSLFHYVNATNNDETFLMNNDYGEYCRAWDDTTITSYNDCKDPDRKTCGTDNWCVLPWCYVTEGCRTGKNALDIAPQESDAFKDSKLYYSYSICGAPNCFASLNNVGCPYGCNETCDAACSGQDSDGNYLAYSGKRDSEFDPLECVPCGKISVGVAGSRIELQNVAYHTTKSGASIPALECNVCTDYDSDADPICPIPTNAPEGYKYSVAARITGACTKTSCDNPKVVDVSCNTDAGYALRSDAIVQISGCKSNGTSHVAQLINCIAAPPVRQPVKHDDMYYYPCQSSEECRPGHGFCDTPPSSTNEGQCRECPHAFMDFKNCDNLWNAARNVTECEEACFGPTPTYTRAECSKDNNDIVDYSNCGVGEFCLFDESNPAYNEGKCTICAIVDPYGSGQCTNLTGFTYDSCQSRCNVGGSAVTTLTEPANHYSAAPFTRLSEVEFIKPDSPGLRVDNDLASGLFLLTGPFFERGFCDERSAAMRAVCSDDGGWSDTTDTNFRLESTKKFNYETKDANHCSTRACEYTDAQYQEEKTKNGGVFVPNRCIVTVINSAQPCINDVEKDGIQYKLAGKCTNGACAVTEVTDVTDATQSPCPEGWTSVNGDEYFELEDACQTLPVGVKWDNPFNEMHCVYKGGTCNDVPRAKISTCRTHAHLDNGLWPVVVNGQETAATGGTVNQNFEQPLGDQLIDTQFNWILFSSTPSYPAPVSEYAEVTPSSGGTFHGYGLICDPTMTQAQHDEYKCIIKTTGSFQYGGSDISITDQTNSTTKAYDLRMEPNTLPYRPIFICGDSATDRCFGTIMCDYASGGSPDIYGVSLCSGKYRKCVKQPTQNPTLPPTMPPTQPPTTTTTSTAHGDPIIWTFNNECYDLNKDGLYDATVTERFNHDVKIGVYNDFMREIQVVDDNGDIIISINSLGEYEKRKDWNYGFSYEEKECPEEMKETECNGTYKEWIFDAQEFQYTVHLLRHDYKDAGIPEGDLGYHLDIYPWPYKSFHYEGHKERYSGLFFENPLPEELEYCPGGSSRRVSSEN